MLSEKTKVVSVVYASNALGTINPIKKIIDKAHAVGAKVLVDGAQATSHIQVDEEALDVDFYAFSGHKIFSPTGIGVLYGKRALLNAMPPYQGGGDMIKVVSFSGTEFNDLPYKFEAGTPNVAGAIGLAAGLDYISNIGVAKIAEYEKNLLDYATEKMLEICTGQNFFIPDEGRFSPLVQLGLARFLKQLGYDKVTIADHFGLSPRLVKSEELLSGRSVPAEIQSMDGAIYICIYTDYHYFLVCQSNHSTSVANPMHYFEGFFADEKTNDLWGVGDLGDYTKVI